MDILKKLKELSTGDKTAVIYRNEILTYKELNSKSEAFASYLLETLTDDRTPIIIYGHKDNDILSCIFGALKSGRAYVPLDITFSEERINQIIKEISPKILIDFEGLGFEENNSLHIINKEELKKIFDNYSDHSFSEENWVKEDDNCYILFTSGSTGKPKGVQITRKNIENFTRWFQSYCTLKNDKQHIMNQVSYSFDVSVIPVYIGLSMGKILYTIDKHMIDNYKDLFSYLAKSEIALWVSTPSFVEICTADDSFNAALMPYLEKMVLAGETLTKKLVREVKTRFKDITIINGYGPTEATVLITSVEVTEDILNSDLPIPIGYPIEEGELRVLDEHGNKLPEEQKGELVVLSNNVSKGYYNRPELTEKVFFEEDVKGIVKRGYKTGDLAYIKDGLIYYCGRKDFQIKLNGFRIELEDIENNIKQIEYISNAIVLPVYKDERVSYLAAFVSLRRKVNNSVKSIGIVDIKGDLKKLIPSYMIPRKIKIVENFPINTNGKIDRKLLMEAL